MIPSSAAMIIQNSRIRQSETSAISVCDVVDTIRCSMHWLAAIKMTLHQYFRSSLDYRDIWIIPTNVVRSDAT